MIKIVLSCIMVISLISGCASQTDYSDYAQSIDQSNQSGQSALTAYFNKKSIDNQNIFKALGAGTNNPAQAQNNQMAIVLYTILSQQNDEKVLAHFTPQYAAKPTTNADIGMAAMNNFLPTLVRWGAGAWLGGKVVDGLSEASTVLGAGSSMVTQNAGGDINAAAPSSGNFNQMNAGGAIDNSKIAPCTDGCLDDTAIPGDDTEWTDTPGCSVQSRAEGRC